MKKRIILSTIFALLLTACGGTQTTLPQTSDGLPVTTQLVLGTLQLEDTDQAVTGEQAKELLPMWQVYQSLIDSGTAAQAEIDGLIEQIQETMTAGQLDAISAMNLTQQDMFTATQEQGGDFIQVRQSSSDTTQSSGGFAPPEGGGAPPDSGGLAGEAPPDGGISGIDGAGPVTGTDQNQEAGAGPSSGNSADVPTILIEALVQYLEQLATA